jgi:L-rhamnose mutarotase
VAQKAVLTRFGCPLKYYVDNHSIFRYVERRDSVWRRLEMMEEQAVVQWKEVLKDLNIDVVYALSPAAKGKVERPYHWLQDHLVRTCVREGITSIEQARQVLYEELHQYNYKRVHSTTKEIPVLRYEKAVKENRGLFRRFAIPRPYQTLDDVFCYRFKRTVDPYRKVSWNALQFSLSGVPIREEVELRISFNLKTRLALIRFWYQNKLVGQQQVKAGDLKKVHF